MFRKIFASALVAAATLVLVPSVLAMQGGSATRSLLNARITGDHAFADQLLVVVTRPDDGAAIFSGPATHLRAVDVGRFTASQQETLHLTVTLASTGTDAGDNVLQGRAAGVAFSWTATQA
ncbi:MAG: hypothetical protein WCF27_14080 [Gaiellaceae bacterium]